jgi:trans-aconitate methyltransferase
MQSADEWDASRYHRLSDPQFAWGLRVLDRLRLRGDETVLDAGCGSGRLTVELLTRLTRGGRVIAVDASTNMLDRARTFLQQKFGDRVTFVHSNLLELDLPEAADLIFSTATFHWITDHPRLFRRLFATLKPDGGLLAQCGGGPNIERILGRAARILAEPEYAGSFEEWSETWEFAFPAETELRLREVGFEEVHAYLEPETPVLPDADDYRGFLETVIMRTLLRRMPDDRRRESFLDRMTELGEGDVPPFSLDYWRLNMEGRKPGRPSPPSPLSRGTGEGEKVL